MGQLLDALMRQEFFTDLPQNKMMYALQNIDPRTIREQEEKMNESNYPANHPINYGDPGHCWDLFMNYLRANGLDLWLRDLELLMAENNLLKGKIRALECQIKSRGEKP